MLLLKVVNILLKLGAWDASRQSLGSWCETIKSGFIIASAGSKVSEEVCDELGYGHMARSSLLLCRSHQILWNM